jgi:hypothetical protein
MLPIGPIGPIFVGVMRLAFGLLILNLHHWLTITADAARTHHTNLEYGP